MFLYQDRLRVHTDFSQGVQGYPEIKRSLSAFQQNVGWGKAKRAHHFCKYQRFSLSNPGDRSREPFPSRLVAHIVLAFAAVIPAGAHAAFLESSFQSRRGRDRCDRASRSAPCRRGRRGRRGARAFRRDNPRLRLDVTSKARAVVEIVIALHDTPPLAGCCRWDAPYSSAVGDVQQSALSFANAPTLIAASAPARS
jgi:hypothetical protein